MKFREITPSDLPAIFRVRVATRENAYSLAELTALGITEASVREKLATTFAGWLCEAGDAVVGFSMADRGTGELWVIAVLPGHEGHGIGRRLLRLAEEWLWANGWDEAWLTTSTDPTLRAYDFYRRSGWYDAAIDGELRTMRKRRPDIGGSA